MIAVGCYNGKIHILDAKIHILDDVTVAVKRSLSGHSRYVTSVSYSCLFSNVWCVLTIEHFTEESTVFPSAETVNKLLVEAVTTP